MTDYIKRIGELQLLADGKENKLKKAKNTLGVEVNEAQIEIGTIATAWCLAQKENGQKLAEKLTLELNELKDSKGKPVYEYTLNKKGLVCNKLNKIREFANSKKVRETFSKTTSFEDISGKLAELELDSWSKMQKWAKDKETKKQAINCLFRQIKFVYQFPPETAFSFCFSKPVSTFLLPFWSIFIFIQASLHTLISVQLPFAIMCGFTL